MRTILKITIFAVMLGLVATPAYSDQDGSFDYNNSAPPAEIKSPPLNKGSNASFDNRLPPVLPGEVVNDGQGKTKVWSTAGSVAGGVVPQAPQAPQAGYQQQVPIGAVIVDDRGVGHRGHR